MKRFETGMSNVRGLVNVILFILTIITILVLWGYYEKYYFFAHKPAPTPQVKEVVSEGKIVRNADELKSIPYVNLCPCEEGRTKKEAAAKVKSNQKRTAKLRQEGIKLPPKQDVAQVPQKPMPQAVSVEEIIPRAVVIEQSIPTAIPQSGPASLLDGVDPDFGKATARSEDQEVKQKVRRKIYVVRQQPPSLYYGGAYGGCPYRYGCEHRNTYPQYGNTYASQVTYGQPYIPPPQTVFIPAAPVIVPAPSVTTPAGTYGR